MSDVFAAIGFSFMGLSVVGCALAALFHKPEKWLIPIGALGGVGFVLVITAMVLSDHEPREKCGVVGTPDDASYVCVEID